MLGQLYFCFSVVILKQVFKTICRLLLLLKLESTMKKEKAMVIL